MHLDQIDHVAIAVHDLDAAIDYYQRAFGSQVAHREIVERDGVEEALIPIGESYIQLTTGTRPDSPISIFLERNGEGIHHIGYRVEDCAAAIEAVAGGQWDQQDLGPWDRQQAPSEGSAVYSQCLLNIWNGGLKEWV